MATEILDDAFFEFDGTDLSSFVRSVTLSYEAETGDDTAMGDDTRSSLGGLKNWSAEVEFNQDYASSAVDDTLFGKVGTSGTVKIRPKSDAVGAQNPEFTGDGVLTSYPPIGGSVGDVHTTTASFVPGGSSPTLTRSTS
jgi:hypothetical protein